MIPVRSKPGLLDISEFSLSGFSQQSLAWADNYGVNSYSRTCFCSSDRRVTGRALVKSVVTGGFHNLLSDRDSDSPSYYGDGSTSF